MGKNLIQINGGKMININVNVENVMYVKKIVSGIFVHVFVKMKLI